MKTNAKMMEMTVGSLEAGAAVIAGNSSPSLLHQSASSSSAIGKMLAVHSSGNHLLTVGRHAGTIYRVDRHVSYSNTVRPVRLFVLLKCI